MESAQPRWLEWAREIQALSQSGIAYSKDGYDVQRYQRLVEIAAEIVTCHTGLAQDPLLQNFLAQSGYATPKVDVRGAVSRDRKILLVRERSDGLWCLPGGWADVGTRPSEMVVREVREESGLRVAARKVVGLYDAHRSADVQPEFFHAYKMIFLCDILGGEAQPGSETLAADFFAFDALPPLSRGRTHERHLQEVMAHLREPDRPAAFD